MKYGLLGLAWLIMLGCTTPVFADPTPLANSASPTSPEPPREPARFDDGSKIALPSMTIPLDRPSPSRPEADRRPMLLGAGVIVLALMFWWNRRRRDRFEREDRGASARHVQPTSHDTDEDADDLHAAARGEATNTRGTPDAQGTPATEDRQDP
jgi:hypothetical protein